MTRSQRMHRRSCRKAAEAVAISALVIGILPIGYVCAFMGFIAAGVHPSTPDAMIAGWASLIGIPSLVAFFTAAVLETVYTD